jgi:hypothetical protein
LHRGRGLQSCRLAGSAICGHVLSCCCLVSHRLGLGCRGSLEGRVVLMLSCGLGGGVG